MTQANRDGTQNGGTYGSTEAAERWQRSTATRTDLGPITRRMLDLARIDSGHRVLDVAAGTGEQTLMAAKRIGPPPRLRLSHRHRRAIARISGEGGPRRGSYERADPGHGRPAA